MRQIGRYQLLDEHARGGMGAVYRARDPRTGRDVAVKLLLDVRSEIGRKRFRREAEALSRVDHPRVVRLLDHGETPRGEPFMVLEWVRGDSLQHQLDRLGPLPPDEAVRVLLALCDALAASHAVGVLHRDLKPDNVLVDQAGQLRLVDFGLARDTDPSQSRTQLTADGQYLGSPGYWAPEQAAGQVDAVSVRTDVYGLAGTLYALLTGAPPHEGDSLIEILRALVEPKPPPSARNPRVPAWLDEVVQTGLAPDPDARFATVTELATALRAQAPTPRRRVTPLALGAVVVVAVAALLAWRDSANPQGTAREDVPAAAPSDPTQPTPTSPWDMTPGTTYPLAICFDERRGAAQVRIDARLNAHVVAADPTRLGIDLRFESFYMDLRVFAAESSRPDQAAGEHAPLSRALDPLLRGKLLHSVVAREDGALVELTGFEDLRATIRSGLARTGADALDRLLASMTSGSGSVSEMLDLLFSERYFKAALGELTRSSTWPRAGQRHIRDDANRGPLVPFFLFGKAENPNRHPVDLEGETRFGDGRLADGWINQTSRATALSLTWSLRVVDRGG